jgi:Na+-transporting NADH:ubiquinone oxidoreductase subunit NqrB
MFFQDSRDYQILFLCSFLFLGIATRDWTIQPELVAVVLGGCLFVQAVMIGLTRSRWRFQGVDLNLAEASTSMTTSQQWFDVTSLKSALITGLGLCLLVRANHFSTMLLAAGLAIASKFIFRVRGKHFFNPANFGIIAVLALTKDAWVSPGQWGTDWWYLALFLATGGLVLKKVGRWETSAVFLAVYTSLEALRNVWLGWDSEVLLHHLSSGSLLVFALFMLTDPRSIPNAVKSRIIWAMSIAILTFVLQYTLYLQTAMFWSLFCLSPLTILLDSHYFFPRFTWLKSNSLSLPLNS